MEQKNRKKSSIRNLIFGVMYQLIHLILAFVCRTLLIKKLGSDILGINSLYSNILTLLSLAELGISNVMLFKLYKPIADGDEDKLAAYINFYKKVYNIIALVILVVGVALIPLLQFIVSGDIDIAKSDLIIYYLIFLFNTVSSYFVVYKQTLINANQEFYVLKLFSMGSVFVQSALKIVFLIVIPNYKIYLIIECVCNLANNILLNFYANKKYPLLKNKKAVLDTSAKKEMMHDVKDTFLYKVGGVLISHTDSIIISVVLSTMLVGYLSNYNLIISGLNGFISIITSAIFASVGSLAVENNPEKSNKIFNVVISIYHFIGAFCGITMFCVFNDFIIMWLDNAEYLFKLDTVFVLSFNFYFMTAITPIYIFRENYGLFKKAKFYLLYAAIVNLVSSVILAYFLGITGVILGTILCRLTTTFYMEPRYLYKTIFKKSSWNYFGRQLLMFVVTAVAFVASHFLCGLLGVGLWNFVAKIAICFAVVVIMFVVCFFKTSEFKYIIGLIKEVFGKFKRNKQTLENK